MLVAAFLMLLMQQFSAGPGPVPKSLEEAYQQVQSDQSCEQMDYAYLAMTMYQCSDSLTAWYFTMPDETLPPGWVRRVVYRAEDGSINMATDMAYYGADEQEPVFFAWMENLVAAISANQ